MNLEIKKGTSSVAFDQVKPGEVFRFTYKESDLYLKVKQIGDMNAVNLSEDRLAAIATDSVVEVVNSKLVVEV